MRNWRAIAATATIVLLLCPGASNALGACECPCQPTTLAGLADCVRHALEMDHIDNAGLAISLTAKLAAAQAAVDAGNTATAINLLNAFVHEVSVQAGVHIDAEHAAHLVMHAQAIAASLEE